MVTILTEIKKKNKPAVLKKNRSDEVVKQSTPSRFYLILF